MPVDLVCAGAQKDVKPPPWSAPDRIRVDFDSRGSQTDPNRYLPGTEVQIPVDFVSRGSQTDPSLGRSRR